MKKLIYTLSAAVLVAFSSCKNDSSVNPIPVDQIVSKVKISGIVKAELNNLTPAPLTGNPFGDAEFIPQSFGAKVIAEVRTENLVLSTGEVTYIKKYYPPADVSPVDGTFTVEVEVGPRGAQEVILYHSDFRSDVVVSNTVTTKGRVFNGTTQSIIVSKGLDKIATNYVYP
jgi:hypothetical protein